MPYDALVIGAGHNGLSAAAVLAKAGRRVLVLERGPRIGGAIQSGEVTAPGFVHDLWSTNMNQFLTSPTYAELKDDLTRHGLAFAKSERPFASAFPDGRALRVYADLEKTLASLRAHDARDADGWTRLYERYKDFKTGLLPLLGVPLPSLASGRVVAKAAATLGVGPLTELGQLLLGSTRELADAYFHTPEAKALVATWGMHLDFGPDVSGGAIFPLVEAFSNMENGMVVARGGASHLVDALAAIVTEHGGEIRTDADVARIVTEGDRAVGVELASGERIGADALLANLTPAVLFGRLLAEHPFPAAFREKVDGYQYGPATMMVHLALDGPIPWAANADGGDDLAGFAYVHLAPYVDDLARTYADSLAGRLPADPLLVVGQTSTVDPSRAPEGQHVAWIQVRTLPRMITGDAAGTMTARGWDEATAPYAERVLDKLERYAPGVRAKIMGRKVYGPADLERHNANLVGGDSIGGSHHLRQNFLFRPFPGHSTYKMPLDGLYLCGAAAWPGAGNNATSGYLAAQAMLGAGSPVKTLLAGAGAAAFGAWLAGRAGRR